MKVVLDYILLPYLIDKHNANAFPKNYKCVHNFLTLYAPCIILQYVYKPTRCTKFW